jgi:hypothetical protein
MARRGRVREPEGRELESEVSAIRAATSRATADGS